MDIHLAGPTHFTSDLLAELKNSRGIRVETSVSILRKSTGSHLADNDVLAKYSSLGGVGIQRTLSVPLFADEDMSY